MHRRTSWPRGACGAVLLLLGACVLDRTGGQAAPDGAGGSSAPGGSGPGPATVSTTTTGAGAGDAGGAPGRGGAGGDRPPVLEVAGELLVALDALDPTAGSASWSNPGTLDDFAIRGAPTRGAYLGVEAVLFDGIDDAYVGPTTPPTLEGASARSVEVWACNPTIGGEETLVAWAHRGGPNDTNFSFNYGDDPAFGAVGHWANDLGWGPSGVPAANVWHHLAYTYDGASAVVYADGDEKNRRAITLATHAGDTINLAAQRFGDLDFGQAGSLWMAVVRVHSGALSPAQILQNLEHDKARFNP